jgi:hypothetical protein
MRITKKILIEIQDRLFWLVNLATPRKGNNENGELRLQKNWAF